MVGDGCTNICAVVSCGDAIVWSGVEVCDDGNEDDIDGCTSACVFSICGDGFVQFGEECDDGN